MARRNEQDINEQQADYRIGILNSVLDTPHGDFALYEKFHSEVLEKDPYFYGHLAAWVFDNTDIRDHKIAFIGSLLTSMMEVEDEDTEELINISNDEHRSAGFMLLQQMSPVEVQRIVKFILEHLSRWKKKGIPNSTRTAIKRYLREIERNHNRFDNAVVRMRKPLQYLYSISHTGFPVFEGKSICSDEKNKKRKAIYESLSNQEKSSVRARELLFDRKLDLYEGSAPWASKLISDTADPLEQAKLIVEHKIPYPIAATIIRKMTPTVMTALVNAMTATELAKNLNALKKKGAFKNEDLKKLIKSKLKKASKDEKVNVGVLEKAKTESNVMVEELDEAADKVMENKAKITRKTAVLIDASGSMRVAIEVGTELCNIISANCESDLYVYAFDTIATPVVPKVAKDKKPALSDWKKATVGIHAGGQTSIGSALVPMMKKNQEVEQFVIITDGGDNHYPKFWDTYFDYCKQFNVQPSVWIVDVNTAGYHYGEEYVKKLINKGIQEVERFQWKRGDYYSLTNILPLLSQPSRFDLLMEIMEYPLPQRPDLVV